jgi:hypothetical protein
MVTLPTKHSQKKRVVMKKKFISHKLPAQDMVLKFVGLAYQGKDIYCV